MPEDKQGGNSANQSSAGSSGSNRPQSYVTGLVQKDATGGARPKPYGTKTVQEGESRG